MFRDLIECYTWAAVATLCDPDRVPEPVMEADLQV